MIFSNINKFQLSCKDSRQNNTIWCYRGTKEIHNKPARIYSGTTCGYDKKR